MGFLVSFSFFFLALVINQSTVVGQTTAESVIEFPKNDIRDVRSIIIQTESFSFKDNDTIQKDVYAISLGRKNAVVNYTLPTPCPLYVKYNCMQIHYKSGVTEYNENWISP
jgi:hypothetical protein